MLDGIDCPPHSDLARMAENPSDADPSCSEHLSCCSPCLKDYMEILADLSPQQGQEARAKVNKPLA